MRKIQSNIPRIMVQIKENPQQINLIWKVQALKKRLLLLPSNYRYQQAKQMEPAQSSLRKNYQAVICLMTLIKAMVHSFKLVLKHFVEQIRSMQLGKAISVVKNLAQLLNIEEILLKKIKNPPRLLHFAQMTKS